MANISLEQAQKLASAALEKGQEMGLKPFACVCVR